MINNMMHFTQQQHEGLEFEYHDGRDWKSLPMTYSYQGIQQLVDEGHVRVKQPKTVDVVLYYKEGKVIGTGLAAGCLDFGDFTTHTIQLNGK